MESLRYLIYLSCFINCTRANIFSSFFRNNLSKSRSKRGTLTTLNVFSESDKAEIVDLHNEARRNVDPTATDMIEIRWDNRLARLAEDYARTCEYKHSDTDYRANKFNFSEIGENLYIKNVLRLPMSHAIESAVESWIDEKKYYTYETKACSHLCGYYTQVVWAKSFYMGCAAASCTDVDVPTDLGSPWPRATIMVCHYGPGGNQNEVDPYTMGQSCTECPVDFFCEEKLCSEPGVAIYQGGDDWEGGGTIRVTTSVYVLLHSINLTILFSKLW